MTFLVSWPLKKKLHLQLLKKWPGRKIQTYSLYPRIPTFLTHSPPLTTPGQGQDSALIPYLIRFRRPPGFCFNFKFDAVRLDTAFFSLFPLQSSLSGYSVFLCLLTSHTSIPGNNLVAQRLVLVGKPRGLVEQGWVWRPPPWGVVTPQLYYLADTWL